MKFSDYSEPADYSGIFWRNIEKVQSLSLDPLVVGLLSLIETTFELPNELLSCQFKRYLQNQHEYCPINLHRRPWRRLMFVFSLVYAGARSAFIRTRGHSDVLLDTWYPECEHSFYGSDMLDQLGRQHRLLRLNISGYKKLSFNDLLRSVPKYLKAHALAEKIWELHRIDLYHFLFFAFRCGLMGQHIKSNYAPKCIISGNDNGFPAIVAGAAGADLILIQNGMRAASDGSYSFANIYISMGGPQMMPARVRAGCRFSEIFYWGSIRLHHANAKIVPDPQTIASFDVLFVSSIEDIGGTDGVFKGFYSRSDERMVLRIIKEYAEGTDARVAYSCRYAAEITDLKALGLFSEQITYFAHGDHSPYSLVAQSRYTLSSGSTMTVEALAMGMKGGFINTSGNIEVNVGTLGAGVEYTSSEWEGLSLFLFELDSKVGTMKDYVVQNPAFVKEFVALMASRY